MNGIKKIRSVLDKSLSVICSAMFAAIVCIGTYQIVTRYLFNSPSTVSEELLTYTFAWMALLVSALVFGKREHLRVSVFADRLQGQERKWLEICIEIMVVAVALVVLLYGGLTIMELTMSQKTASLGIPMGAVYAVVPLTGLLISIYGVCNIMDLWKENMQGSR